MLDSVPLVEIGNRSFTIGVYSDIRDLQSPRCHRCRVGGVIADGGKSVLIVNDVPSGIEIPPERSRMERVFLNLITNALQAMPHGGKIRIGTRMAENCVLIEVEDTGPGIPSRIHDRLFEPFVTAGKNDGLGLGLAISRQTVLDHGGDLWTGAAAAGAHFTIRLPMTRDEHTL
jgi:signal transduction histidine kinase